MSEEFVAGGLWHCRERLEAERTGKMTFYVGPCAHGHDAERFVQSVACVECTRLKNLRYRKPKKDSL